jgi:hypothetical protein
MLKKEQGMHSEVKLQKLFLKSERGRDAFGGGDWQA